MTEYMNKRNIAIGSIILVIGALIGYILHFETYEPDTNAYDSLLEEYIVLEDEYGTLENRYDELKHEYDVLHKVYDMINDGNLVVVNLYKEIYADYMELLETISEES
ncbi:unnamed protein product [marine sediment metagenome]|uniref:Uncharacterized protein n=1 Tax=marine sediment metagenome TaxID=412755 RepID=X1GKN3_9ZZZZ